MSLSMRRCGGVYAFYRAGCASHACTSSRLFNTAAGDAVCGSYRNSEGYGNVATDNQPASPETDIHCDDKGCRHLEGRCCCADHVSIDERGCGPECATRAPRETGE